MKDGRQHQQQMKQQMKDTAVSETVTWWMMNDARWCECDGPLFQKSLSQRPQPHRIIFQSDIIITIIFVYIFGFPHSLILSIVIFFVYTNSQPELCPRRIRIHQPHWSTMDNKVKEQLFVLTFLHFPCRWLHILDFIMHHSFLFWIYAFSFTKVSPFPVIFSRFITNSQYFVQLYDITTLRDS